MIPNNELLFYGGLALSGLVLVVYIMSMAVSLVRRKWLSARLDAEYGPEQKQRRGR